MILFDFVIDKFFFRYDKLLKPRLELIVRNLNRPNDDKQTDPVLLDTYRLVSIYSIHLIIVYF